MFCSKCGNQMNDNERFCPKCGNDCAPQQEVKTTTTSQPAPNQPQVPAQAQPAQQPTQQAQAPAQPQPVQQTTQQAQVAIQPNTSTQTNTIPKKKSKKPLIAVIAIVLVVAIVVSVIFILPKVFPRVLPNDYTDTTNTAELNVSIIKNQYGTYYLNGRSIILTDGNNNFKGVMCDNGKNAPFPLIIHHYSLAYDGNTMYGKANNQDHLSKFTFTDKTTITEEVWVDEDVLKYYNLDQCYFRDFQINGNYIYFTYMPIGSEMEYQLIRIDKDGNNIEFLDVYTNAYVIYEDWIYYHDTGFIYEADDNSYHYNCTAKGFYKIQTDGSNKQFLSSTFNENLNADAYRPKIYDNTLYYDIMEPDGGKIYKMDLDGSNLECLVDRDTISYTIDSDNNKLYYTDEKHSSYILYELDLATGEDKKLFEVDNYPFYISYNNNYIYFTSDAYPYGKDSNNVNICGERFNLQTGELEKMMGYCEEGDEPVIYLED